MGSTRHVNNMDWKGIPNVSYPITKEPRSYSRVVLLLFHLKTMVSGYALTLDFTVEVEGFLVYIYRQSILSHDHKTGGIATCPV